MKIGFCGTMSVGKTTLVNALKELPEFKDYKFATERSEYLRDLGIPLNTDSTIKGQLIFLAERTSELLQENIITDRTVVDVIAFTKSAKSISWTEGKQFEALAENLINDYDYLFYVSPKGVELEDNGVRTIDKEYRKEIDKSIKGIIEDKLGKHPKYTEISGSTEERIEKIKQTIFH